MLSLKATTPEKVKTFIDEHFDISVHDHVSPFQEGDWSYCTYTKNEGYELVICSDQAFATKKQAEERAYISLKKVLLQDGLEKWLGEDKIINEGISIETARDFAKTDYDFYKEISKWNKKYNRS